MFPSMFFYSLFFFGIFLIVQADDNDNNFQLQRLLKRRFSRSTILCTDPKLCMSQYGYCGTGSSYCGSGCQSGPCTINPSNSAAAVGACADRTQCRSQFGYCGAGLAYCGAGCQSGPCGSSSGGATPCADKTQCRSQWGYCGTGLSYCGSGCQVGPCTPSAPTSSIININNFACAFNAISTTQQTNQFKALNATGWKPTNVQEAAVFLAHVYHETNGLQAMIESCAPANCPAYSNSWCGNLGSLSQLYYGRGWFQLTYPCNYYYAGSALGAVDLLHNPDLVANDPNLRVTTALWYYTANHMDIPAQQGNFAATTKILNGQQECKNGPEYNNQLTRVQTYIRICKCFGVVPNSATLYC